MEYGINKDENYMKIAIVGSRFYDDKLKIKNFIYQLKEKYGDSLMIVSGGCRKGADYFAKKYAIEFEADYKEFNPAHTTQNLYSACYEGYYGKPYAPRNFFSRNKLIAKYSDVVVAFISKTKKNKGTMHTVNEAKKLNKTTIILD